MAQRVEELEHDWLKALLSESPPRPILTFVGYHEQNWLE